MDSIGSCRIIFGPMFSGKTTTLIHELATLADLDYKVLYINHSDDVRSTLVQDAYVTTHHSQFRELSSKITAKKVNRLSLIDTEQFDVIGIDEGHFFDDLEVVREWIINRCKTVIIASLDGDYLMQPFGKAHHLICLCDPNNVTKLGAACHCCLRRNRLRIPAGFTAKITMEGEHVQKDVGGAEKYISLCMKCYKEHTF